MSACLLEYFAMYNNVVIRAVNSYNNGFITHLYLAVIPSLA